MYDTTLKLNTYFILSWIEHTYTYLIILVSIVHYMCFTYVLNRPEHWLNSNNLIEYH